MSLTLLGQDAEGFDGSQWKKGFIENRGQLHTQDHTSNDEVLFLLQANEYNVQLRENGFSYDAKYHQGLNVVDVHRMDVDFVAINQDMEMVASEPSNVPIRYYNHVTAQGGVNTRAYDRVLYRDVFDLIDVEFVFQPNNPHKLFEYNFILHPGADIADIKLRYSGQLNSEIDGGQIHFELAHGRLTEEIPLSYYQSSGQEIEVNYVELFKDDESTVIGLQAKEELLLSEVMVVDPTPQVEWFSYSGTGAFTHAVYDSDGTIRFASATTMSGLATSGAYQSTVSGSSDIVTGKLSADGQQLLWCTYFGGSSKEEIFGNNCIDADEWGNHVILGRTSSSSGISTTGAHQENNNGNKDLFIARFNSQGSLSWSTYYGGLLKEDSLGGIACGPEGEIACFSGTQSKNWESVWNGLQFVSTTNYNIATQGAYQEFMNDNTTEDWPFHPFLVLFDSAGSREFGTYLGQRDDLNSWWSMGVDFDPSGSLYVLATGYYDMTSSAQNPTTNGTHKPVGQDKEVYLGKFSPQGLLLWGTFYGTSSEETAIDLAVDGSGAYFCGWSMSSTLPGLVSPGAYDTISGARYFVAKFNNQNGTREWGTLSGSPGLDYSSISLSDAGHAFLIGRTWFSNPLEVSGFDSDGDHLLTESTSIHTSSEWGVSSHLSVQQDRLLISRSTNNSGQATNGVYEETMTNGGDGFIAVLSLDSLSGPACIADTFWLPDTHMCAPVNFFFYGSNYNDLQGVAYSTIFTNSVGCDSVVAVNYFGHGQETEDSLFVCDTTSVFLNGVWHEVDTNVVNTYQGSFGCDSSVSTKVRFFNSSADTCMVQVLPGDSALIAGQWQSQQGWYLDSFQSYAGCDSLVYTYLQTINTSSNCQASSTSEWVFAVGSEGDELTRDVEVDACGNTYVLSHFGVASVDMNPLGYPVVSGDQGYYILKYNNQGQLLWKRQLNYTASAIAVSATSGKIAVTGVFNDSVNVAMVDGEEHWAVPKDAQEIIVATYNSEGSYLWSKEIKTWDVGGWTNPFISKSDISGDVVFGLNDEVCVSGRASWYSDTMDFDNYSTQDPISGLPPIAGLLARATQFVVAYSSNGEYLWHDRYYFYPDSRGGLMENAARMIVRNDGVLICALVGNNSVSLPEATVHYKVASIRARNVADGGDLWENIWYLRNNNLPYESIIEDIAVDHNDNVYLVGTNAIVETDSNGLQVPYLPNGPVSSEAYEYIGGSINNYNHGGYAARTWILKIDRQGEEVFSFAAMNAFDNVNKPEEASPARSIDIIGNTMVIGGDMNRDTDLDPSQNQFIIERPYGGNKRTDIYIGLYTLEGEPYGSWVHGGSGFQWKPLLAHDHQGYLRLLGEFKTNVVLPPDSSLGPITDAIGEHDWFLLSNYVDSSEVYAEQYDTLKICYGDTVSYLGQDFTLPGLYTIDTTLLNTLYESIRYVVVEIDSEAQVTIEDAISICSGDSALIYGVYQNQAGVYYDTIFSMDACDTLLITNLEVAPPVSNPADTVSICEGDSVWLNGAYQTEIGWYVDSFLTSNGCDSIVETYLQFSPPVYGPNDSISICPGDSAWLSGAYQFNAGWYVDSLVTNSGCDSIVQTYLQLDSTSNEYPLLLGITWPYLSMKPLEGGWFEWYRCDNDSLVQSSASTSFMVQDSLTAYYVVINGDSMCQSETPCWNMYGQVNKTGGEQSAQSVSGYPSMVDRSYTIEFNRRQKDLTVHVVDLHGRVLRVKQFDETRFISLDCSDLPRGYYFVRVSNAFHNETLRFIKMK